MTIKDFKSLIRRSISLEKALAFDVGYEIDPEYPTHMIYSKNNQTVKLTQTGDETLTVKSLIKLPDDTTILLPWNNIWYTPQTLRVHKKFEIVYLRDDENALGHYIKNIQKRIRDLEEQISFLEDLVDLKSRQLDEYENQ